MNRIIEEINCELQKRLSKIDMPHEVRDAMIYSVSAGGKRLRPALLICFCESFGGSIENAMPYACAMEMIHTYSLIHDDLPAMDNDDLRRGHPTCHKVYGEGMALLAGDGLLNYAYETMLEAAADDGLCGIAAARTIACGAGVTGMIAGQCMDLSDERGAADYPIEKIHAAKTGAMIRAACVAGAILGGADEAGRDAARHYGEALGLSFQITDDILDVIGDEKKLGKPVGSDAKNEKRTFVSVYGMFEARKMAEDAVNQALLALQNVPGDTQFMRDLAKNMLLREA